MSTDVTDLLFVYGSLMPSSAAGFGREQRDRLAAESELMGAAAIEGRLYDLGSYPGLVEGGGTVHGELLRLADPELSFVWLDPFEDIVPGQDRPSDYQRLIRPVRLETGRNLEAWVYLWVKPVTGARFIADGRWVGAL